MKDKKHAWVITEDHLYKSVYTDNSFDNEAGTAGPYYSPAILTNGLNDPMSDIYANAYEFRMYDDDGELYYTGLLATLEDEPDTDALMAPLYDFGGPNAGATRIKYTNHPEWTIEY